MKTTNVITVFILLALCWLRISAKPATSRCDLQMLNDLGQVFLRRKLQLGELYCKQRQNLDGTPKAKCSPVVCLANSDYQNLWQLGYKSFHKRLSIEVEMLEKAVKSLRRLQHQVIKDEKSFIKVLRNQVQDDIVEIGNVSRACYQSDLNGYPLIKKSMDGDFMTFPLSKERANACSSGGRWQQLTFMADLIQLYNDMYNSLVDFKSSV